MSNLLLKCKREGCENVVPPGRRMFCCDDCAKLYHRHRRCPGALRLMGKLNVLDAAVRTCLSCNEQFLSDGPWNRLCDKCKRREVYQ